MYFMVRDMNQFWIIPIVLGLFLLLPSIHAETITQNFEGGMDVEITYPDDIVKELVREAFHYPFLVQNNGWED